MDHNEAGEQQRCGSFFVLIRGRSCARTVYRRAVSCKAAHVSLLTCSTKTDLSFLLPKALLRFFPSDNFSLANSLVSQVTRCKGKQGKQSARSHGAGIDVSTITHLCLALARSFHSVHPHFTSRRVSERLLRAPSHNFRWANRGLAWDFSSSHHSPCCLAGQVDSEPTKNRVDFLVSFSAFIGNVCPGERVSTGLSASGQT